VLKKGGYQSIDVPGAEHTRAFGVNVQGDIVGGWNNSGCDDCFDGAFLLTSRGFEELEFPGALGTVALASTPWARSEEIAPSAIPGRSWISKRFRRKARCSTRWT